MPARRTAPSLAAALSILLLSACNLDSGGELLNVSKVQFSEGSPAVEGQNVTYSGGVLETPSLDKFRFKMVFKVRADNSKNSGRAVFGTDAVKPVLNFRIQSRSATPIATPIPCFSIAAGAVENLEFPIEVPLAVIDRAMARKIVNGDPIPYFLSGSLKFELFEGAALQGAGQTEIDLTSGEIATRPSGSVTSLLSNLL